LYCFFLEEVGARFKIDPLRFDDFFRTCIRQTLAQMLCDIHRAHRRSMNGASVSGQSGLTGGVVFAGNTATLRGISSPLGVCSQDFGQNGNIPDSKVRIF
jgi:hypothetical protein